jgi:PAS domain S-box-containing protein
MPASSPPVSSDRISSGEVRFTRLRLGVIVLGAIAIIAFAGSSAYDAWRSYHNALGVTDREIGNVANALAEQTAWTWEAIDLMLLDTERWYRHNTQGLPPERIDEILAHRASGMRQIRSLSIVDAQGIQRHSSSDEAAPNLDVSSHSYFIVQRDHPETGIYISEPLLTADKRAGVVLSRRFSDGHGGFGGIVTAVVDLENLKQFYRAVNLGAGSAVHLVRADGTLLARSPAVPGAVGKKYPSLAKTSDVRVRQVTSPIDGRHDFIAVAHVRDTPLMLAVTRESAVALEPWQDEAIRLAVRTLTLALLGVLTIAVLLRQLRRVESGEHALHESEERYALVMEGANEGHWDADLVKDRLFLSRKMKTLHGQSDDDAVDTWTEWLTQIVIHPEDAERFDTALRDHFEGRTPRYECEYRVRQPDGEWRWLLARGRCLRDAGMPSRFVGSAIDLTAQKRAQLDKEHLEAQLRQSQKLEAVGTLAGGIAHDFNNILGAILGYGELAQQDSPEGSAVRRYIDNVMHAAGRAKSLVERILGFSRSGLGERVPVNVQYVIEETLELLAASLPAGIRLERQLEAGNAAVIGDATHLHQVAMNLCTNALHAMEHDGAHSGVLKVVLEPVEVSERQMLSRGTLSPGPYVRLAVSDTGTGIPPAVYERIFDPFFTTKRVGEGTGLGLPLVHGIVTDLGGAIDVITKVGDGTTFEIWLPVSGEIGKPVAESVTELRHGNGEVVMIVDDERPLVALAEETLADLSYEPVGFDSSGAALQAFQAEPHRFDLILTDEAMPDLTGTALAREIRRLRPDIPIVLMSGHGGAQLARQAAAIGVTEVLNKPLRRRDLAEALARALPSTH